MTSKGLHMKLHFRLSVLLFFLFAAMMSSAALVINPLRIEIKAPSRRWV